MPQPSRATTHGPENDDQVLAEIVTYVMDLCAVGGGTGQSDWSDAASGMAR